MKNITTLIAFLLLAPLFAVRGAPQRPNIVIIFMDDMGYADIGPFGATKQKTPNLDRLANEGMKLTSFYAAPVCSVSRAQLLTGCYGARVSVPWVYAPGSSNGLNPEEITIAERLKELGYATMCIGKWHVGDQPEFLPTQQGFDHYFGIPYSNDMQHQSAQVGEKVVPLVRDDKVEELLTDEAQSRIVERYTDEAIRFIMDNKARPFFLYLPHNAIHTPIHPGEKFAGKSANGRVGDWIEEVDASTGRILETLRALKLAENTLVIFTSDNGPWLSKGKDSGSAGPLRGGKGGTREGGVRVPALAWWPGKIAPGSVSDAVTGTIDLLPTAVTVAGGTVPAQPVIDGRDLSPLLLGKTTQSPREAHYYFSNYQLQAVRQGAWKLALATQQEAMGDVSGEAPRLYNLEQEIGERTNLADKHPDIVARLKALADKMNAEIGGKSPSARRPAGEVQQPKMLYETVNEQPTRKKPADIRDAKLPATQAAADGPVEAIVPTAGKPFPVPTDPAARKLLQRQVNEYMALPPAQVQAHPAAVNFPGVVPAGSARVAKAITFQGGKKRWQSTGLYVNAGEIVTVIPEGELPAGVTVEIRVGCHTDRLFREEITQWKRFPLITRTFPLLSGPTPVANAFGGPLFISVKRAKPAAEQDFRFQLRFSNAVAAPFFALGETSVANWQSSRSNAAPWGELVGRNMILHIPADQIRGLADPTALLEWWDKVVAAQDELVGWPTRTEQERVVPDRQISAGYMHSGYPFMCQLGSAPLITDLEKLKAEGSWGFFHELGHNHQSKAWTFPGQGEVTVNFFSLYCMEKIVGRATGAGHPALTGEKLFKALDRRLGNPPSTDPFDQLAPFVVLLRKFGWPPMQQTLASYQTDPIDEKAALETKETEFVRRYSRNAKADLTRFFKAIGYTCPDSLCAELKSLPAFTLSDYLEK